MLRVTNVTNKLLFADGKKIKPKDSIVISGDITPQISLLASNGMVTVTETDIVQPVIPKSSNTETKVDTSSSKEDNNNKKNK